MLARHILGGCGYDGCNCTQNTSLIQRKQEINGIDSTFTAKERQIHPKRYIYDQYGYPIVIITDESTNKIAKYIIYSGQS